MISYCATCHNRLQHVIGTLEHNLSQVADAPAELILLDYGSTEDVVGWVSRRRKQFHFPPNFKLFRALEATHWWAPHAKNVCHKLAEGKVVCNLDCDQFILAGQTGFLLSTFLDPGVFVAPPENSFYGRIAFRTREFIDLGGYDEDFRGYAFEDTDIVERAAQAGLTRVEFPTRFRCGIQHEGHADNLPGKPDMKAAMEANFAVLVARRKAERVVANVGRPWGDAVVERIL
jgi:hypothetical protein